jgi:hypothetical protein
MVLSSHKEGANGMFVKRKFAAHAAAVGALCVIVAASLGVGRPQAADGAASGGPQKRPESAGEFRGLWTPSGAGFGCLVPTERDLTQEETKSKAFAAACQHIGPFVIGGDAQTLNAVLGAPDQTVPQPKGAAAKIYFLGGRPQFPGEPGKAPYLVATVLKNSIISLQVTGPAPAAGKDFSFNLVDLGDSTDKLIKYFGPAKHVKPSEIKGTNVWSYGSWPFSFEITDGHVTSIKITDVEYRKGAPAPQVIWSRESAGAR